MVIIKYLLAAIDKKIF